MTHPLDVPVFLQISQEDRKAAWLAFDLAGGFGPAAARAEMDAGTASLLAERKRVAVERLMGRLARKRARDAGETRRAPLQGRDALRAIKEEN